jgi:Cu/Ag efflux pump CusA
MQQPLAVAVIGGFVSGLPLLLLVLPSLMRIVYRKERIQFKKGLQNRV